MLCSWSILEQDITSTLLVLNLQHAARSREIKEPWAKLGSPAIIKSCSSKGMPYIETKRFIILPEARLGQQPGRQCPGPQVYCQLGGGLRQACVSPSSYSKKSGDVAGRVRPALSGRWRNSHKFPAAAELELPCDGY